MFIYFFKFFYTIFKGYTPFTVITKYWLYFPCTIHPCSLSFYIYINLFILLYFWLRWDFLAAHGLFSGCGEQGLLFVAIHRLLIAVASLVVEHGL